MSTALVAAAMVARDARYAVSVIVPYAEQRVREAADAAEQAGVDVAVAVHCTRDGATVHFIARHQDRRVSAGARLTVEEHSYAVRANT